jgi:hypothetical protein
LLEPVDQRADEADDVVPIGAAERGLRHGDAEQRPEQDEEQEKLTRRVQVLGAAFRHRPGPGAVEQGVVGGRHEHM